MARLPFCISRIDYESNPELALEKPRLSPEDYDENRHGEFVCPYCGWHVHKVLFTHFSHSRAKNGVKPPWCSIRIQTKRNGRIDKSKVDEFKKRRKYIELIETQDNTIAEQYPRNETPEKRKPPVRFNSVQTLLRYLYFYFDNAMLFPGDEEPRLVQSLIKPITDTNYDPDVVYLWYMKIEYYKLWNDAYVYLDISQSRSDPDFRINKEDAEGRFISGSSVGRYVAILGKKVGNEVKAESLKMVDLVPEHIETFFKIN